MQPASSCELSKKIQSIFVKTNLALNITVCGGYLVFKRLVIGVNLKRERGCHIGEHHSETRKGGLEISC